jgi:YVTN family beta-propeller protein
MLPRILALLSILLFSICGPALLHAGPSNSLLDLSSDGALLACANRDSGTVTIVDRAAHRVLREIRVGNKPEGISFIGETHELAVALYAEDRVAFIHADTGATLGSVEVFDEPYGVVATSDGKKVYVTLEYPGKVVEIDAAARTIVRELPAGAFPRGLALAPDRRALYVTEYLSGSVLAIDLETGKIADRWPGTASENLARQIALHPTRPKAYVPHIRSRTNVNRGEGSVVPFVSVVDLAGGSGRRRKPLAMDGFHGILAVANPWEVAISPDGNLAVALFSGSNDLYVANVLDDNYRELSFRKWLSPGLNPRAVRFAPDGATFYVYTALDFTVTAYDPQTASQVAKIVVCENPLGDEILRGKILFYSALEPMVGRRWISCSSCHPDGDPDGRTWQNPEGLRNTNSLFGMAWTHPIHWSSDRDEVQDFEHTIRSELMQGRGLIKGSVHGALDEPNRGRSADLDALAAYSNSHKFTLSPHARGGLSEAAQRGREIFFSNEARCAECHSGPFFTDSRMEKPFRRHDVGTGTEDKGEKMGPAYDTPPLLAIYRTAPYLHHGKAQSLEEVLTKYNPADQHGKTSHLLPAQIADLVEFLKALPYEDPEPLAHQAGLQKIEK